MGIGLFFVTIRRKAVARRDDDCTKEKNAKTPHDV